ncbi:hypothetical protein VIGAN_01440400 [Vigna angularis var. angularis]|uniref:Uncharacterized protein n=1 Tax=Vigna angularis var. angularis TaxID=157739 RepID=A0A0S3R719_PHAAN|nr:hypothetical protein VIGAN_01440400 [Vigna angularis var. angularis]
MSFTAKAIVPCCNEHANDHVVRQNHHAPPTSIQQTAFNGHPDFLSFLPVVSMEGDDDDDDGSYDYAPAA